MITEKQVTAASIDAQVQFCAVQDCPELMAAMEAAFDFFGKDFISVDGGSMLESRKAFHGCNYFEAVNGSFWSLPIIHVPAASDCLCVVRERNGSYELQLGSRRCQATEENFLKLKASIERVQSKND